MANEAIAAVDLRKTYQHGMIRRRKFEALKGVSFSVKEGEIFGLLGPNGAGKTTFIKILLGIIRKTGGNATVLGNRAGSIACRRRVGYLPEHLRIRGHHTGYTALEYYGQLSGLSLSEIRGKQDRMLDLVGLRDRAKNSVKEYSKGMLQRLGLAQALLHEPQVMIMDEPTDGLDPAARADVRALMTRLRDQGKTIFLNSHILQEVELVCDRVAILNRGDLKFCGAVDEVNRFLNSGAESSFSVQIRVSGDPNAIANIASQYPHAMRKELQDSVEFTLRFENQGQVDNYIDQCRGAKLSIIGLQRDELTLEEAFLQIVNPDALPQSSPEAVQASIVK